MISLYKALFWPLEIKRWMRHTRTLLMQCRFKEQETEYKKYKTHTQHIESKMPGKKGGCGA